MVSIETLALNVMKGKDITSSQARSLWKADLDELLSGANALRRRFKKDAVKLCSIINAKSGACSENCAFCAQSAHHRTSAPRYSLVGNDRVLKAFTAARDAGAGCFSIVTSGRKVSHADIEKIGSALKRMRNKGVCISASLGEMDLESLRYLKRCGLKRFHHNLETAESFFSRVCTTHAYSDRLRTIAAAKEAGLEVCCGGIFGLGETEDQRVEFALTLKKLRVDSVPMNFLNPIAGTPLGRRDRLSPREALRTIAVFRFILPRADISVCGGRETTLRDLQSWIFKAGANGMMVGGYLTTGGRDVVEDLRMIADLGLSITESKSAGE